MEKNLTVGDQMDALSSSSEGANYGFGKHEWDVEVEKNTLNLQQEHLDPYYPLLLEN